MIPSFLLSLREGLEAALIIGIVLGALRKTRRTDLIRPLWMGVLSAAVLSLLSAWLLRSIGAGLEGRSEEIFEGFTMLFAAGVLTWMIFWMNKQSRNMEKELESNVQEAANRKGFWAIFFLAFISVLREGIELALYLTAISMTSSGLQTLLGTVLGLLVAFVLGYLIYTATLKLNLKRFFQVTAVILILFAAGLITHSIAEFNEAGVIPAIIHPVWNVNHILDEQSSIGIVLRTLFGYSGSPSLTQVLGYSLYILATLLFLRKTSKLELN